jgi:hypothetical protein
MRLGRARFSVDVSPNRARLCCRNESYRNRVRARPTPRTLAGPKLPIRPGSCQAAEKFLTIMDLSRHDSHRAQVRDPDDEEDRRQADTAVAAVQAVPASAGNVGPRHPGSRQQAR